MRCVGAQKARTVRTRSVNPCERLGLILVYSLGDEMFKWVYRKALRPDSGELMLHATVSRLCSQTVSTREKAQLGHGVHSRKWTVIAVGLALYS